MPRRPPLHDVDDLLTPAFDAAIQAIEPPASDGALVQLGRVTARTLDAMSNAERRAMWGQTLPGLLKILVELERRREKRGEPEAKKPPSQLDLLRQAHARTTRPRGGL